MPTMLLLLPPAFRNHFRAFEAHAASVALQKPSVTSGVPFNKFPKARWIPIVSFFYKRCPPYDALLVALQLVWLTHCSQGASRLNENR